MNKQKRRFFSIVSMALGVTILTVSAFANYDNSNGYSTLKNAAKKLVLTPAESMTMSSVHTVSLDGKQLSVEETVMKKEGRDKSSSVHSRISDGKTNTDETYDDGKTSVLYDPQTQSYSTYANVDTDLFGDPSEENAEVQDTNEKIVRFAELLGDAVVGDLKNSVVLTNQKDGVRQYTIDLSQNQIPEIVTAGLFLIESNTTSYADSCYVDFEDPSVYNSDNFDALCEKYYRILEEEHNDKGVLYVKKDGTTQYYATEEEYQKARGNTDSTASMSNALDSDVALKKIFGTGTVDENGNLTAGKILITLSSTGSDGKVHEIAHQYEIGVTDIGTTKADTFDPTGKTDTTNEGIDEITLSEAAAEESGEATTDTNAAT